ncbi:MAG: pilin [Candidatus Falkowbacteria bacterium]
MKNIFNKKFLIAIIFSIALVSIPYLAYGAGIIPPETGPSVCAPGQEGRCGNYSLNDGVQLMVNVANWILGIVGSLALLMFVLGGFMFLISGGNAKTVEMGKGILIGAVIGLILVFSSYMIIQFSMSAMGLTWSGNTNLPTPAPVAPIPAAQEPCAVQFGSQGYACMVLTNGHDCKTTLYLCPNGNNTIKCCLPN